MKPIIGITMGDPAGIGPEITIKSLSENDIYDHLRPIVIGDARVARQAIEVTRQKLDIHLISSVGEARFQPGTIDVLEEGPVDPGRFEYGRVYPELGEASVAQSKRAIALALDKKIDAVVSAPVNKEAMRQAGFHYEGQTQLFGEETGSRNWGMILVFGHVRCMMLTNHMSLLEAIGKVKKDRIVSYLELMDDSMSLFAPGRRPVMAVSALNPHGGESGLFGREEKDEIEPAIEEARQKLKSDIVGPVPSDTIFVRARDGEFDAVLSLFHDQANMAIKLIGFGEVVTYILGLPIIRCSVGHGTAFDIAGQNIANHRNLKTSILTAADFARAKLVATAKV